ncbi:PIG-X [Lentinula raphanica]|nr:PIG-X [Lentinula raphanica]
MVLTVLSSIDPPHGFHRTIRTSIILQDVDWIHLVEQDEKNETRLCSVHLHYEFPVLVFVDPYELANYQHLYTFELRGNANLELPVAAMEQNLESNGALLVLLLNLNPKLISNNTSGPRVDVKVPIHLRYGEISRSTSRTETHRSAEIAWPEVFLSCGLDVTVPTADTMSLTSYNLSEEIMSSSFEGRALFRPLQTLPTFSANANQSTRSTVGSTVSTLITAPIGQSADITQVRLGTALTMMGMFWYMVYVAYWTARRLRLGFGFGFGKRSLVDSLKVNSKVE